MESGNNPNLVSPKGAVGPAQILPETAKNPGYGIHPIDDPTDPIQAKQYAKEYITTMKNKFGSTKLALMSYNWGAGNVSRWLRDGSKESEIPEETKNYITKFGQYAN